MEDAGENNGETATPCKRQRLLGGPDQTAGESAQPAACLTTPQGPDGPRPTRTRRQWSSGVLTGGQSRVVAPTVGAATPMQPMPPRSSVVAAAMRLEHAVNQCRGPSSLSQAQDLSIVLRTVVKLMSENEYQSTRMKELGVKNQQLMRENEQLTMQRTYAIAQDGKKQKIMEGMREHAVEVKNLVHESEVSVIRNGN